MKLREMASHHVEPGQKLDELEHRLATHDRSIAEIIQAIRQLSVPQDPKRRPIGFVVED